MIRRGDAMSNYKICARCVLDITVPSISFDSNGVCNFCKSHDILARWYANKRTEDNFSKVIKKIKDSGKNKKYDCIVGFSGGTDSSSALWLAQKSGLRPLAVHVDNGWNTEESVSNIKNVTSKLGVDLFTYVFEWEEFKDLQIAFLKASVPCIEAPTDVGIHGALMRIANERNIKYILGGQSFYTEGTVPREWSYLDGNYIKTIQDEFGAVRLRSFPNLAISDIFYYTFIKGIRQVPILNYTLYSKDEAKKKLAQEFNWKDYGGHHYESVYTKFAGGWFLYNKFRIDKRKVSLSGPIRSGLLSREEALGILENPPNVGHDVVQYCVKKLGLTESEFDNIMKLPLKTYKDYFTSESLLKYFKIPMKLAVNFKMLTPVLYEKYYG
jgi:N-acetyl sugar amidotransferase